MDQQLSPESMRKAGYFDSQAVQDWRQAFWNNSVRLCNRASVELGLVGMLATQEWYQTFIDSSLADLLTQGLRDSWTPSLPLNLVYRVGTNLRASVGA